MEKEQARLRREEAQKANMLLQARRIAEQREIAARKKSAETAQPRTPEKQLSSRSVYAPAPQPAAPAVARPEPMPAAVVAPAVRPKAKIAPAAPTKTELAEMRAELQDFAHEAPQAAPPAAKPRRSAKPAVTAKTPAPVEEHMPEISVDDLEIDSPGLEERAAAAPTPLPPPEPTTVEISLADVTIVSPGGKITTSLVPVQREAAAKPATLKLKMAANMREFRCPKCGGLIPETQRGAYYTECRRCGEIIKSDAA